MKALISYAPYDNRLEDIDIPQLTENELLLKVHGCGICAGDIKSYHGGIRVWGTNEGNRYIETPVINGHEFFGEIIQNNGKKGYEVGEMVVVEQINPCQKCKFCKEGKYWMCVKSEVYGFKQDIQGGFAEYIKIHKNSIVHKIPISFTKEQSVLIEPIACGMHAIELANIEHNDVVVIAGLGAIGTSMVNLAKLCLPRLIIGIDIKQNRLDMGKKYGAEVVLNALECDVVEEIKKLTDNCGCSVYIEASGSQSSVNQGLNSLANHGKYVQMGVFSEEVKADWNTIGDGKELIIKGSHLSALTYKAVIDGIESGIIKTDGLISHSFSLEEWEKAFETIEKDETAMKVMLIP